MAKKVGELTARLVPALEMHYHGKDDQLFILSQPEHEGANRQDGVVIEVGRFREFVGKVFGAYKPGVIPGRKRIYLGGKVTGLPVAQVVSKFRKWSAKLADEQTEVFNPVEYVWQLGMQDDDWQAIMRSLVPQLMLSDELHLMPCWQDSHGAKIERDIARSLGIRVVYH